MIDGVLLTRAEGGEGEQHWPSSVDESQEGQEGRNLPGSVDESHWQELEAGGQRENNHHQSRPAHPRSLLEGFPFS